MYLVNFHKAKAHEELCISLSILTKKDVTNDGGSDWAL
jgi:hypothetical protein